MANYYLIDTSYGPFGLCVCVSVCVCIHRPGVVRLAGCYLESEPADHKPKPAPSRE